MNPTSQFRSSLSMVAMIFFPGLMANSAVLFWDGNSSSANADGGAGTWNLTNTNWDSAATGGTDQIWNNIVADSAVFGGVAGTVTLDAPISVSGLTFNTTGYVINGSTTALSMAGDVKINLGTGVSLATLTGGVAGSGSLTLSLSNRLTTSTLLLNGTSTGGWTGFTKVDAGTILALAQNSRALVNTSAINLNGGTISVTNNGAAEAAIDRISNSAPITSNGGTISFANTSGSTVYSENIGNVQLTSGQTNFAFTTNQTSTGSQTLTLAGLTRTGASNTSAVTFSSSGNLNTTKNRIVVTGASLGFIGPWATAGTAANAQTDYAFINGSSQVAGANIAATAENSGSWVPGANVTLNAPTTLTASRTINTLRYSGVAGTLSLGANNLATNGILSGGSGDLIIAGTGALMTPTGGGNLFITAGSRNISVSAPINNNGGNVTLVKSGSSNLILSSSSSNYSGGTVINSGSLIISDSANLGIAGTSLTFNGSGSILTTADLALNRPIIINNSAIASFGASTTIDRRLTTNAAISGTGGIALTHNRYITLTASSKTNTFSGPIFIGSQGGNVSNSAVFRTNSLIDSVGAGNIIFGSHTAGHTNESNGQIFMWGDSTTGTTPNANISGPLTLNNRAFVLAGSGQSAVIWNGSDSAAQTITVNTDLQVTTAGSKTLFLAGPNTGENTFAGKIVNGAGVISLTKKDAGRWILSGDNNYTGLTTVSAGRLNIRHANALGTTAGGVSLTSGATLEIQNNISVGAEALTLRGTGITSGGALRNISGDNTWGGVITLATDSRINSDSGTLTLDVTSGNAITGAFNSTFGGSGNVTVNDAIATGARTLTKDGTGTLTLNSTNTYTGATNINNGTTLINGSTSSSSIVTVATAGTLGGTGTIGGATTVNGKLRPGIGVGLISFGSSLSLASASQTTMNIDGTSLGSTYDAVSVGTNLGYGGALVLDIGTTFGVGSYTFDLFSNFTSRTGSFSSVSLSNTYSGSLTNNGSGVWNLANSGHTWTFNQSTGDLTLVVIPEPSTAVLIIISTVFATARRRK